MELDINEASYPLEFRQAEAALLGEQLKNNNNVELVGMKRVGIGNFLRFFLYNKRVADVYIGKRKQLFVPVDLNDLVEREIFPFWTLTLKRIADAVATASLPPKLRSEIDGLFLSGIQSGDHFLLLDAIRQALLKIVNEGYQVSLFFIRFDRIKDAATPAFYDNLQGLRDATHHKVSYVFTSFRTLNALAPSVFPKAATAGFTQVIYIKPADQSDLEHIYTSLRQRFALVLTPSLKRELFEVVAGNVQYLQLAMITLNEKKDSLRKGSLLSILGEDERIHLQSEELWESLSAQEKEMIVKVLKGTISEGELKKVPYLTSSGLLVEKEGGWALFSPLLTEYVEHVGVDAAESEVHFTKKEHTLFTLLEEKKGSICTRDEIIETVWPEAVEFGVSDWAIDRLVARVRSKLRSQKSPYEITTIRTRGYKLQGA